MSVSAQNDKKIKLSFAYGVLYNHYDYEPLYYYDILTDGSYSLDNTKLMAVDFEIPTKIPKIDILIGTTILEGPGLVSFSPGFSQISNGGAVYVGVAPKILNKKHFGITSSVATGFFNYKFILTTRSEDGQVTRYAKYCGGLGATSTFGIYIKVGQVAINPRAKVVLSGNSTFSSVLLGWEVPLKFYFKY